MIKIPHEKTSPEQKKLAHKKFLNSKVQEIKDKIESKTNSNDEKILINACLKLMNYIIKNEDSLEDTNDVVRYLQLAILGLQRKKKKIVEKLNRKMK